MPEGATPNDGDGGATPPTGQQPPEGKTPASGEQPDGLGDAGKKALDAERDARQEAERKLSEQSRELQKFKDAQLSEDERKDKRIKELEAENASLLTERQRGRVERAAIAAARKEGFWDPDLAYALIDEGRVQFDESGQPKNIEALVKAIAADKPKLINGSSAPDFGGGHRGGAAAGADMNALIRRGAGRG